MNRRSKQVTRKGLEEQIGRTLCSRAESTSSRKLIDIHIRRIIQGRNLPLDLMLFFISFSFYKIN